jgi:hypothetical protein
VASLSLVKEISYDLMKAQMKLDAEKDSLQILEKRL